ncbi:MAG TPA: pseudouridine synthase [Porphyromonadaceae bacterium]|nr:pseudouridine synthase [Porphyromonadaceae bacterium]
MSTTEEEEKKLQEENQENQVNEGGERKRRERVMVRRPLSGSYQKIESTHKRRFAPDGSLIEERSTPSYNQGGSYSKERGFRKDFRGRNRDHNEYPNTSYSPRRENMKYSSGDYNQFYGGRGGRTDENEYSQRGRFNNSFEENRSRRPTRYNTGENDGNSSYSQYGYKPQSNSRFNSSERRDGRFSQDRRGGNPYSKEGNNSRFGGNPRFNKDRRGGMRGKFQGQRGNFHQGGYVDRRHILPQYNTDEVDANQPIRLNKIISNAGICSRREADELIQKGEVMVNDNVVTELGTKILPTDKVVCRGKEVGMGKRVYILLNKPKDYVTTLDDPEGRKTVLDLLKEECKERVYPVGRLDRNSTGVLLLTNDGELTEKLTHPKYEKKKVYNVLLDKNISEGDMQKLADGIELEDGNTYADAISYSNDTDKNQVGVEIHSGKNRIIRRMFDAIGYKVLRLDRVLFAGLTKKGLRRGEWRYLTPQEVSRLQMGAYE